MNFWVIQTLGALSLGMLLFVLAAGLSMIFGLMRIINVAHGSFYMLGAYIGLETIKWVDSFVLAIVVAAVFGALFGALIQKAFMEHLVGHSLRQILLTFGFLLVFSDITLIIWHGAPVIIPAPTALEGSLRFGNIRFPIYRLFVIAIGLALAVVLDLLQKRTRIGAMVRAGADDIEMLGCMGYNVPLLFVGVFAFGTMLATVGGVLGGVFLGVYPGIDLEVCILAFVVVIVGGLGSIRGTLVASLLVAAIDNLSKALIPELSMFAIFMLMVVVLALKPRGLFGQRSA